MDQLITKGQPSWVAQNPPWSEDVQCCSPEEYQFWRESSGFRYQGWTADFGYRFCLDADAAVCAVMARHGKCIRTERQRETLATMRANADELEFSRQAR
jgi:hypothetical protein